MAESDKGRGWLPPEPPGQQRQPAAATESGQSPPTEGPPPGGAPPGRAPPGPAYGHHHPPPPGYPPPAYGPGTYAAPSQPSAQEPGNGEAVAALVLGICSLAFLLFSGGLSTIVSLICAVLAIIFGRRGKRNVDAGETRRHRGLAQAGYITGIVGTALSILATAFWVILFIVADDFEEDFNQEFQRGFDQSSRGLPFAHLALAVARGLFS
ncbi:MAG: DUF4190 domain-containing protein [Thermoleophilaceae bacterium]|nr:DUF4190 domain-containing protein [Thermoleophilaceae bacterium]